MLCLSTPLKYFVLAQVRPVFVLQSGPGRLIRNALQVVRQAGGPIVPTHLAASPQQHLTILGRLPLVRRCGSANLREGLYRQHCEAASRHDLILHAGKEAYKHRTVIRTDLQMPHDFVLGYLPAKSQEPCYQCTNVHITTRAPMRKRWHVSKNNACFL